MFFLNTVEPPSWKCAL